MPQRNKWRKVVSSIVMFSLLSSYLIAASPVLAETSAITKFSDVPSGHWAAKHISKLALQGIVKGTAGAFHPSDNVTQQEAVTMAVRFIGKENEIKQDPAVVFPPTFKMNEYFKPYIVLAFEQGLLDRTDEFKQAEASPADAWGSRIATREWITKLIIKSIGQQSIADNLASSPVSFSDGKSVSAGFAGYVNAAVSLKLVNGVTADKFEPNGAITRAALATMLSRAERLFPVAYAGQQTGILSGSDSSSIRVYGPQGETNYQLTPETNIYRFDSEKTSSLDQLNPYTKVMVIADGDKALYIEQLDGEQHIEKIAGTFDRVIAADNKLWLWVGDEPVSVVYDSTAVIKDASGAVIPVTSLIKDSKVEITRDTYRDKPLVLSITVQSAPVNKSGQGVVKAIQQTPPVLTVVNSVSNAEETYSVSPQADVVWQGTILQGGISQVRAGDTVTYEVKDSIVTKISVQQTTSKTVQGEFYSASDDSKTIQYVRQGGTQLEAKFVADSVVVTIEGLTGASMSDLVKGDNLELTLNQNDQVTAVKVLDRKVEMVNGAVIVSYDPDLKALVVKSTAGKLIPVYLSDKTKIDYNGTAMTLNAAGAMLTKNRKVTIGYTDDKAVILQFVYKYTGTVVSINSSTNQITLMLSNGSPFTIAMDAPGVEIYGKSPATLSDVKTGDTVTALLNANQDKAVAIQVQTAKQLEIVSVDLTAKKVKLKSPDQVTTEWAAGTWDLFNERGDKIALSGLTAGQVGNLTFMGTTAVSFKTIAVTNGRITSVAADKVVLTDYNGASIEVPLGSTYTVVKNGASGSSASVLQAGDRVEVRKDAKEQILITVNSGITKTFWKFDSSANVLSVKRSSLSDSNYTYQVTAKTIVSQGNTAIPITHLKDGDSIVLYLSQGVLVEIAKQP
ncbi:S-layer homology domain-containing protein [Paenibacillus sp. sptzw28]|uniref:S-layer homology domain-containing protein n=1 Tax=Paenibacillus sp. sptzw28 TaxID=715179 RepID=UPI001C6F14A0|nr:S-layer homology domain-containing protein [Paenibacillus sp. sptzw28]QYR23727.1 S-layer homology domain-containing protein [Paenibacillus sp. sptzw28]